MRRIRFKFISSLFLLIVLLAGCSKDPDETLHIIDKSRFEMYWGQNENVSNIWGQSTSDTIGKPGEKIWVSLNDATYAYYQFDDYLDAQIFFEDTWYDPFVNNYEAGDFSGYFYKYFQEGKVKLSTGSGFDKRYTGIVLFNGKFHGNQKNGDCYGGAYLFDNTVILAYTEHPSSENRSEIDAFLNRFDYPAPKER